MPDLSVVIPVYLAEACLQALHERLIVVLQSLGLSYEIIFIEDHGPDNSWAVLVGLAERDPQVRCYQLSRNFGQHAAITAGLSQSLGSYVVVMDCDLQDPPEAIPQLVHQAKAGNDVVLAKRKEKQHSFFRRLSASLYFRLMNQLTRQNLNGKYGSFSLISRKVVNAFLRVGDVNRHYLFIVQWLGFATTDIEYVHAERYSGESSYTLKKLIQHALQGLFFQTTVLLHWIVYLGFASAIAGILVAIFLIYQYMLHAGLPGWTSLAVLILVMSGLILICIGVVGSYLGKIFEQVQGRPVFIIDKSSPGEPAI